MIAINQEGKILVVLDCVDAHSMVYLYRHFNAVIRLAVTNSEMNAEGGESVAALLDMVGDLLPDEKQVVSFLDPAST